MEKMFETNIDNLALRAKEGSREAFSEIVRLKMNSIIALTYKMTGSKDSAKDLAQETFISAWENIKRFRGEGSFNSWLMRIASNKSLNFIKTLSRMVNDYDFESSDILNNSITAIQPDKDLEKKQLKESVLDFMQTLPPQQRLIFELRFYKELSFEEISSYTNKALGTVKTNYREAVIKLRKQALEKGWRS